MFNTGSFKMIKESLLAQLEVSWALLEYHLKDLSAAEMNFEVTHPSLSTKGFPEIEAYDIGMPTIAWTMWHIDFWWSMALDYNFGNGRLTVEDIDWPRDVGTAFSNLADLKSQWVKCISEMSEEEFARSKEGQWPLQNKPFYEVAGWLNLELMKNAAEIGSVRFAYGVRKEK